MLREIWALRSAAVLSASLLGCSYEVAPNSEAQDEEGRVGTAQQALQECPQKTICTTWTKGRLTVRRFECPFGQEAQHATAKCQVPTGEFVLVGGGAEIAGNFAPGALLTGSFPSFDDKQTWVATSKDHIRPYSHNVRAFAVGLKLDGLSYLELRNLVKVGFATSGVANHPTVSVPVPAGHAMLSGGAQTIFSGAGQLLTRSSPANVNGPWIASSKDHVLADPGRVRAFVVSMPQCLPQLDYCVTNVIDSDVSDSHAGYWGQNNFLGHPHIVTGVGVSQQILSGQGRLLNDMFMTDGGGVWATTKDHEVPSAGTITVTGVYVHSVP
jgi:hypothetical protein